jgi:hypothetical protein
MNNLTTSFSVFDKQILPIIFSLFISEIDTYPLFYGISFSV